MKQAIPPVGGARNDFDMLAELADRLNFGASYTEKLDERGWLRMPIRPLARICAGAQIANAGFGDFWALGHAELPAPLDRLSIFAPIRRRTRSPLHPAASKSGPTLSRDSVTTIVRPTRHGRNRPSG
jgi:biotin/methionine sulfoxide reductase